MKKDIICWDSSVMIDHVRDDQSAERNRAIQSVAASLERGQYQLIISTLLYVEVLESAMTRDAMNLFNDFVKRREIVRNIAVTLNVAKKAQSIRNRTSLKTPDAIHIATAIIGEAKVFHTFDKHLLALHGESEVEGLSITACDIPGTTRSLFD